jgi:hypothetical protein
MAANPVTPGPGLVSQITTGGSAVKAVGPSPNGGFITNPATATETLFVDPVGLCGTLAAGGTIFGLAPGQSWDLIPGQTTPTYVNAASNGHTFSVVVW